MKQLFKTFLLSTALTIGVMAQTVDWNAAQIVITNKTELRELASLVNGGGKNFDAQTITLASDINLENVEWMPIGTLANPFKGVFDGAGFVISGVFINDETKNDVGLFGYSTATIKNLGVIVNINAKDNVGGLLGMNSGENSIVENCFVSGTVVAGKYVGGLVGRNWGGSVKNCYATVSVEGKEFGTGGLVGSNDSRGSVSNCYAVADVKGNNSPNSYVGKLVGSCYLGVIESSYALNDGGGGKFVGYEEHGTISQNSGLKTEVQMKQQGSFFSWNFNDIWGIDSKKNYGFPYLLAFRNENVISIVSVSKANKQYGILLEKSVVSDVAKINIKTPEQSQINLTVYDNTGNVVFETSGKNTETFVWSLTNNAGRNVANGSYLIVVEAKGVKGTYACSAKVGVKR